MATLEKVLKVTSMTRYGSFSLIVSVCISVRSLIFLSVFSVQKQSIPVLMIGKDAVIRSQTGSGRGFSHLVLLLTVAAII